MMKKNTKKEDKRKVFFMTLQQACDDFPKYTAGDILYSTLRKLAKENKSQVSFLRSVSDEDLFIEADARLNEERKD